MHNTSKVPLLFCSVDVEQWFVDDDKIYNDQNKRNPEHKKMLHPKPSMITINREKALYRQSKITKTNSKPSIFACRNDRYKENNESKDFIDIDIKKKSSKNNRDIKSDILPGRNTDLKIKNEETNLDSNKINNPI